MSDAADRIVAFSLTGKWATLADDQTLTIATMLDVTGEETDNPDACFSFVCGPRADGKWLADWVANFDAKVMD